MHSNFKFYISTLTCTLSIFFQRDCDQSSGTINITHISTCSNGSLCDAFTCSSNPCSLTSAASCQLLTFPVFQPFDATSFCAANDRLGRYLRPSDLTCKKFILCYLNIGVKGAVFTCPGRTFFNDKCNKILRSVQCRNVEMQKMQKCLICSHHSLRLPWCHHTMQQLV